MNIASASDEIAAFIRVVDKGSFAAAAQDAGMTASGYSKIVSRLEDRLGVKLLLRTTRRLALTAEGETFLQRGRDILAAIEAAEAEVTAARGRPAGLIRINTSTAFARHALVPALPLFRQRFPDVQVDLAVADRRVDVMAEAADVVIRTGPLGDSSYVARRLGASRRVICAAPDYLRRRGTPGIPADLAGHECLRLTGMARLASWPMRVEGRVVELAVTGAITCDNAEMLLDMALRGLGIVRLSGFMLAEAIAEGRLVPLLGDHHVPEEVPISALMPPGRQHLPRIRSLLDVLTEWIGEHPFF